MLLQLYFIVAQPQIAVAIILYRCKVIQLQNVIQPINAVATILFRCMVRQPQNAVAVIL